MLKEYAVDPDVVASDFQTCRYLLSQFGADRGRLIAKFPSRWKRMAFAAAERLPDGRQKERIVEYLNNLNAERLTLVDSRRDYTHPGDDWLSNAIAAHRVERFRAIISDREDPANDVIDANHCDENAPLFAASREEVVKRDAQDLAQPAAHLLRNTRIVRFVDPYLDPAGMRWREPLKAFLALIPDISRVRCEFHIPERDRSPPLPELKRRLARLDDAIPHGGVVHIVRWREQIGGERFHGRYVMTDKAGLRYDHGLDEDLGGEQTTDVSLLAHGVLVRRWAEFDLDSDVYELVPPVLAVYSDGCVEECNS